MNIEFYLQIFFLALGLSMDACIVSMANGLNNTKIKKITIISIALIFGLFQGLMPFLGFIVGSSIIQHINPYIPYITLIILSFLGYKMIIDGIKHENKLLSNTKLTFIGIIAQGIGTSIDALSVGLTLASLTINVAIISCLIIAVITFIMCILGVILGKKFGTFIGNKAEIIGGSILIILGLEMFLTKIF